MKADVVIGAGFGDEGKGLMTDYLASQHEESIVIRFNGGAQAGHTVVTPDGRRHVFSHFSSGSFVNSHTYLSQFFIVNPMVFMIEGAQLVRDGVPIPRVTINPDAMVTTPYDMFINQMLAKGNTCGLGINETVTRHSNFALSVGALKFTTPEDLKRVLIHLRDRYTLPRLEALGIRLTSPQQLALMSDGLIDNWLRDVYAMLDHCTVGRLRPKTNCPIIFEGAQGLLLDEDHHFFPAVTRSKTGMANVVKIAEELGIEDLSVNYMVRAYMSRHGDGEFPTYDPEMAYEDNTNIPNAYQGSLRFGMFDYALVDEAITEDREYSFKSTTRLVVTHLDQMPPYVEYKVGSDVLTVERRYMAKKLAKWMSLDSYAESWGPTRKDIRIV